MDIYWILENCGGVLINYIDPKTCAVFSTTSSEIQHLLLNLYKIYGQTIIQPFLSNYENGVSTYYTPLHCASIMYRKCAICGKNRRRSVRCNNKILLHGTFGISAHDKCIRNYVKNVYYLEKNDKLTSSSWEHMPYIEFTGWGDKYIGQYTYKCLWEHSFSSLIPYEWTIDFLYKQNEDHMINLQRQQNAKKVSLSIEHYFITKNGKKMVYDRIEKIKQALKIKKLPYRDDPILSPLLYENLFNINEKRVSVLKIVKKIKKFRIIVKHLESFSLDKNFWVYILRQTDDWSLDSVKNLTHLLKI
jgi:hypothetical protein